MAVSFTLCLQPEETRHIGGAPDMYRVHYDFSGWPAFHALWQVAGPRKSYEMSNHYEKRDI